MRAKDELASRTSCINRAHPEEFTFVLLARDIAAPETIRFWCAERIRAHKNTSADDQIKEAMKIADRMEAQRRAVHSGDYK